MALERIFKWCGNSTAKLLPALRKGGGAGHPMWGPVVPTGQRKKVRLQKMK